MLFRVRPAGRVTINEVAAAAGVSVATVSKVINDRYGVAASTAARVREVIDQLGYESSLVARSLRSHRTNVIGILVADLEPFSAELLKGVSRALHSTRYELIVYSGNGRIESGWERKYLSRLSGTLTDGTILVTPTVGDVVDAKPVVAVDPHAGSSRLPTIDSDNLDGAITATEYLLNLGHRRIGFLAGRPDLESASLREQGYRQALLAAGLAFDPALVRVGGYQQETAEEPARELLALDPRPTAIFAANDLMAIETLHVARSFGLRVPDDLSVIGFDNIPESALAEPPLTTIDQSIQQIGYEAARLLVELIDNPEPSTQPPVHVTLPTKLVERQTCRSRW